MRDWKGDSEGVRVLRGVAAEGSSVPVLDGRGVTAFELISESTASGFGLASGAPEEEEGSSSVKREEMIGGLGVGIGGSGSASERE